MKLEEVVANRSKFIQSVEAPIAALLAEFPEDMRGSSEDPARRICRRLQGILDLSRVVSRFPIFDPSGLMRTKEVQVKAKGRSDTPIEAVLRLPAFACESMELNTANRLICDYSIEAQDSRFFVGGVELHFPNSIAEKNQEEWRRCNAVGYQISRFRTVSPAVPKQIQEKVEDLRSMFQHIVMAWEAEWEVEGRIATSGDDPLIIGEVDGLLFLIDQFDATKLERYVASEYVRKS